MHYPPKIIIFFGGQCIEITGKYTENKLFNTNIINLELMMKITIITPFRKLTDSRASRLAQALVSEGFEVQIRSTADEISGKLNNKITRRICGYLSALKFAKQAENIIVSVNCEYTIISWIANIFYGKNKKIWADIYDNHEFIFNRQPYRFMFKILEHAALLICDSAILPVERRLDQYSSLFLKIFKPKIYFISNIGFEKIKLNNCNSSDAEEKNIKLVYAGTIDNGRGILPLVKAAENSSEFINLEIYGSGPYLDEYLEIKSFRKFYKGTFKFDDIKEIYKSADVISGFYELSVRNNAYCDPNKMREVYEFQIPIITNSGTPLSDVVLHCGVGAVISNMDSASILNELINLKKIKADVYKNLNDATVINQTINLNNMNLKFLTNI